MAGQHDRCLSIKSEKGTTGYDTANLHVLEVAVVGRRESRSWVLKGAACSALFLFPLPARTGQYKES
jgi:hypothetical protein